MRVITIPVAYIFYLILVLPTVIMDLLTTDEFVGQFSRKLRSITNHIIDLFMERSV